ncbi:MAG: 50S ribosomal protein L19 [Chloroflexi bacterium]|nr:50S ribosomal protein L19 [Chloroflexota bacterium]
MEAAQLFKKAPNPRIPRFNPGDTVRVNFRIREGERERIQVFQGVVTRFMNGKGPAANFTVRRITAGIGIDRVFPLNSPLVESLEITRYGSVRRAKLYYIRGLQGRSARIKELNPAQRRRAMEKAAIAEAEAAAQGDDAEMEVEETTAELDEQAVDELVEASVDEAEEPPEDSEDPPAEEPSAEEEPEKE